MHPRLVVLAALGLALAGCTSDSPESAPATSSAVASPAEPTSAPQITPVPAPVMVEPDQSDVTATVGQAIVFDVGAKPGRWDITTDKPEVLQVLPGGKDGGATFNPGAQALAPGTATVTLTDKVSDLDALEYTVTVTE